MTLNKLGLHIDCNREYGGQFEAIAASPPPVVVAIINPNDPNKAAPFLANVPYLVLRYKTQGRGEDAMIGTDGLDPKANAGRAYSEYSHYFPFYPRAYWAYYRNEIGDWNRWEQYADEMVAWIEILASHGYKAAVGNFSVGTPDYLFWDSVGMTKVLHACETYGALLNLHEYGLNCNMPSGNEHTLLRYRQGVPANLLRLYPKAKIVIGEVGLDRGDGTGGAWRQCGIDDAQYLAQLRWYNGEIIKDAQVVGAAIYQWSAAQEWASYDIDGPVTSGIFADIRASTPTQPAPPPTTTPEPPQGTYEAITTRPLNARLGTSDTGYVLQLMPAGTRVKVIGDAGARVVIETSVLKDGVRPV